MTNYHTPLYDNHREPYKAYHFVSIGSTKSPFTLFVIHLVWFVNSTKFIVVHLSAGQVLYFLALLHCFATAETWHYYYYFIYSLHDANIISYV